MKTTITDFNKNIPLWKIDSMDFFWAGDYCICDSAELLEPFLKNHSRDIDKRLNALNPLSLEYNGLLKKRFLTFNEYLILSKSGKISKTNDGISIHALHYWQLLKKSKLKHLLYNSTQDDYKNFLELFQRYLPKPAEYFFSPRPLPVPTSALNRHCLITGRTGSGKTSLMQSLFYWIQEQTDKKLNASLILIDPHGDISSELMNLRLNHKNPNRLWYVDPHLDSEKIPCINPFWKKVTDPIYVDLLSQQWAKAFAELIPEAGLSMQMESILKPCLSVLFQKGGYGLVDLQKFMDDTQNEELVALGRTSKNPVFRSFFEQGFLNKKYALTKLSIYTRLQHLMNNYIFYQMMNGPCTIDIRKGMEDSKVMLFNLSKGKLGEDASKALGKFLTASILSIALQRAFQSESSRKACYVFIDELQNVVTSSIESIFTESRKYNLKLITGLQASSQLPLSIKEVTINNTALKLVGINGLQSLKSQATDIGVPLTELQSLAPFHFYLKYDHHTALKIKSPDFLIKHRKLYFALPNEVKSIKEFCLHQSGIYRDAELPAEDKTKTKNPNSPDNNPSENFPRESSRDFMPKFDL